MTPDQLLDSYHRFKFREDVSHDLLKHRINEILLVSTFYDAYIFEQDGVLSEQLLGEYSQLNLSAPPRVTSVPTAADALATLEQRKIDLVITTMHIGDVTPFELAARVKASRPDLPVLLLLNNPLDILHLEANRHRMRAIDDVFLWSGDSKVFLAMVKSVEDRRNLAYDTRRGLVRVILLIEDSVHDYSAFLPLLYTEVVKQTGLLISEENTESYKRLRMSLRPKVIVAHDFAEAERVFREYRDYLICIITDVEYERAGSIDPQAGLRFIEMVRRARSTVPVLLQSLDPANATAAAALGAHFLCKDSPHLLGELRDFIVSELGFGDFLFRLEDGTEISRAGTMVEFITRLRSVPDESILFHASHNHFSGWLIAHGEVAYAKKIQPARPSDFPEIRTLRKYLVDVFDEVERGKNRGRVVDLSSWERTGREQIVRLREGSLGGKGRGLAFLNALLYAVDYHARVPGVDVSLPLTAIIGTNEFDEFLERNRIDRDIVRRPDEEIRDTFLHAELSDELKERLAGLVQSIHRPLAVRSSGLLEDSQACPFAGVYKTFMLPNGARDPTDRYEELQAAIKLVYASVFERSAREYVESVHFKIEEEKMAVVLQEMVGARHGEFFYPDIAGVAQSHNFYSTGNMQPAEGVASVVLGLGRTAVQGGRVLRFCPRHPTQEILAPREQVAASQKDFWSVRLNGEGYAFIGGEEGTLARLPLRTAETHGTLDAVASVWDHENDRLVDGLARPGPRVITFANILKYSSFPLAELLDDMLHLGEKAMGVPVEIEFAANVRQRPEGPPPGFFLLQIRPMSVDTDDVDVPERTAGEPGDAFVYTHESLGNGILDGIGDIVYVDPARFRPTETLAIQQEVSRLNRALRDEGRKYILIGPGRWGSRDRFLGVPVLWPDISEARTLVEADLHDFRIDASQGTHFLHNVVAMRVGYLKVRWDSPTSWVDWTWLAAQDVVERTDHCVHVRTKRPCVVRMDGKSSRAVIRK